MEDPQRTNEGFGEQRRRMLEATKEKLNFLRSQRDEINTMIDALEASVSRLESESGSPDPNRYFGIGAIAAIRGFIKRTGKPQTEDAIIRELLSGGFKSKTPGTEKGNIRHWVAECI